MLQVSVGFAHACGLRTDGTITCWGAGTEESVCETNNCGQALPPDGVFTSVSAGRRHTCAVASDETVQCWGVDAQRQASPPAGAFVKVAAGDVLTCGIRVGGQVVCWGNSADPEDIDGEYQDVSVAIGSACGITTDGLLQCWGTNPFDAPSGTFTQVSIGLVHGCAVRTDRSLECFTNGALYPDATPLPGPFRQVAVGMGGLGIDTNGVLHCWGVAPNVCREFPH
jgi:alpha-tubulin suppressor-like RCC1 family protein